MIMIHDKSDCTGCNACSSICPQKCICMESDGEGFWYPVIDSEKCVNCGLCEKVCPILNGASTPTDELRSTQAIAGFSKDSDIRNCSSSGGIFSLIAESIISQGGVVFGAAFNDTFKDVQHIYVEEIAELEKLRGSKCVQSLIGDSYRTAKTILDSGRIVLFSGTPCQIAGLYSFLGKSYDKLFTQDIICHGVPSPLVWKRYVDLREKQAGRKTRRVNFRDKKYGWRTYAVKFEFSDDKSYVKSHQEDSFMRAFLSNLCLRPSCHNCRFKSLERQTDLTLADCWGIGKYYPEMDDDRGTSLVLIHSNKGKQLLDMCSDRMKQKPIDLSVVEKYNRAATCSSKSSRFRDQFITTFSGQSFEKFVNEHYPVSYKEKIKIFMARTGALKQVMKLKRIIQR